MQRQTVQRELQEVLCLTASVLQTQGQPFIQAIQKALTQSLTISLENCDIFLEVQIHKKSFPFGESLTVISLSNCQFFYYTLLKVTKKYEEERRKKGVH